MKYLIMTLIGCVAVSVTAAEYHTYPLSGHPNYIEPSTFPEFEVNLKGSIYLTHINGFSALKLCATISNGSIIELDSRGGSVAAGHLAMTCIADRDVTIAVTSAGSMATLILLAGSKVCIHPDANIAFHLPSRGDNSNITKYQLDLLAAVERRQLSRLGYSTQKTIYLERFARLSNHPAKLAVMPHGTMGGILGDRFVGYCKYIGGY